MMYFTPVFKGLPSLVASPCPSCISQARRRAAPVLGEVRGREGRAVTKQMALDHAAIIYIINEEGNGIESTL